MRVLHRPAAIHSHFSGPSALSGRLPRRAILAMALGCGISGGFAVLFGPSLRAVLAEEQDQRQVYTNLLSRERGYAPSSSGYRASPIAAVRSLFNLGATARHAALPEHVRAYAPSSDLYPAAPVRRAVVRASHAKLSPRVAVLDTPPASAGAGLSRRSVCVRLCDGFAFPVGDYQGESDIATHSAICAGLCPGAPTRLYVSAAGSEDLANAISTRDHKPYSALPTAMRYASVRDDTCSCHAPGASVLDSVSPLKDFTLRPGDKIMTAKGFRVFRGANKWPYNGSNFTSLASARIDRREKNTLSAMERATRRGVKPLAQAPAASPRPQAAQPLKSEPAPSRKFVRVVGPRFSMISPAAEPTPLP